MWQDLVRSVHDIPVRCLCIPVASPQICSSLLTLSRNQFSHQYWLNLKSKVLTSLFVIHSFQAVFMLLQPTRNSNQTFPKMNLISKTIVIINIQFPEVSMNYSSDVVLERVMFTLYANNIYTTVSEYDVKIQQKLVSSFEYTRKR
jgi:hypothetical protein